MALFIGLMSGTSLDGIDGVLVDLDAEKGRIECAVRAHARRPFAPSLRAELLELNASARDEIHRGALAANALARCYAEVVADVLKEARVEPSRVAAIGCHGQTVRHRPGDFDGTGYTVQLNGPALLAELTGIDVIADFRSRDIAAGGQGAPLVPAFHARAFGRADATIAVVNIGGIANVSFVDGEGGVLGFDCGPGNVLLDLWVSAERGLDYDPNGAWAAQGTVDPTLLRSLASDDYFARSAPKSTGRDRFNAEWLEARLGAASARNRLRGEDVQATLAELTAQVCAEGLIGSGRTLAEVIVCGGGAFNTDLLARLARRLAPVKVVSSAERGLPPDQVEACAFAWLASAFLARTPGNVPSVTGAAGPRILGALYPA